MSEVMEAEEVDYEQLDSEAQAGRTGAYAILASLLCDAPSMEVIQKIAEMTQNDQHEDALSVAFAAISTAAHSVSEEQLEREYHALFIGVGRGELLPYGSFYLTGFLMEKPLGVLRDDLGLLGYARQDGIKEPEDHIAFLCEVMAQMITDGLEFDRQKKFFEAHIAPWAGRFFAELSAAESAEFYSGVGDLGQAFMAFEESYFSMSA
jgi:TorA maturation chaperone TorD